MPDATSSTCQCQRAKITSGNGQKYSAALWLQSNNGVQWWVVKTEHRCTKYTKCKVLLRNERIFLKMWRANPRWRIFLRCTFSLDDSKYLKVSGMQFQFEFRAHYSRLSRKSISNLRVRDWGYNLDLYCSWQRWEEGSFSELNCLIAVWVKIQSFCTKPPGQHGEITSIIIKILKTPA